VLLPANSETVQGADGKQVFLDQKCNMCHAVSKADIAPTVKSEKMQGPDLAGFSKDVAEVAPYLKGEVERDGVKHKKKYTGSDEDLQTILTWAASLK
jgi:cytochrome c5